MSRARALIARLARRRFAFVCLGEAAFLVPAAAIAWIADLPLLGDLHWSAADLALGAAAALPMLAVPWWAMRSRLAPIARLRALLEHRIAAFFRGFSPLELVVVSAVAGVGEEVLFRAVVQGGLAEAIGPLPALAAASVLFGAAHPLTRAYAAIAAAIGLYLGALWMLSGNLLVPIVAHAGYDALVLLWLAGTRGGGAGGDQAG